MIAAAFRTSRPIQTKGVATFERVPLYAKQAAIVDDMARFTVTEATTKAGKTMSHIEWMLDRASELGRGNHWWVAPVSAQSNIAFRRTIQRLKGYIDSSGHLIRVSDAIAYHENRTERFIEVFGASIWFKSADKPDSLYGEDVYSVVLDESTRTKADAWTALYTTLTATKGRAKLIGNVRGRKNWSYRQARKAEKGDDPEWAYHKLTAYDAIEGGVIDAETVEQARRDLSESDFKQLYEAEAADDQSNPFGASDIAACVQPMSDGEPYVWGWDLAKSVDWTVGIALDEAGHVCRFERWQKVPWSVTTERIRPTVKIPGLIDSTGVGDPIVEDLLGAGSRAEGYKFTSASKQQLMEGLAYAIQHRELGYPDGPIRMELDSFEYQYTRTGVRYSAPDGEHDDCVVALALARAAYIKRRHVRDVTVWFPGMEAA